jgi:rhodanese-related sulfurtransferase
MANLQVHIPNLLLTTGGNHGLREYFSIRTTILFTFKCGQRTDSFAYTINKIMTEQIEHYESKLKYEIDSADVAGYFTGSPNGERIVIIDTRSIENFEDEHIPGAISFPHRTMNAETVKVLDKDVLYVTYCDGIGCNGSTKGALKLSSLGFRVKELLGGLDWWRRDGYSTEGRLGVKRKTTVQCAC